MGSSAFSQIKVITTLGLPEADAVTCKEMPLERTVMAESWTKTLNNGVGMRMLRERTSWKPLESQVMLGINEDSQLQVTYRTLGRILALYCLWAFCLRK